MTAELAPDVLVHQWFVMWGTRWTIVAAASKEDARAIGLRYAPRDTRPGELSIRRLRTTDEEAHASWRAQASGAGKTKRGPA